MSSEGSTTTAGTVHGASVGAPRPRVRGRERTRPGESCGPDGYEGSSTVTDAGLPGWIAASASEGTANGCGRAVRSDRRSVRGLRSPSSAHSRTPRAGECRAWTTNTPPR